MKTMIEKLVLTSELGNFYFDKMFNNHKRERNIDPYKL